MRSSNILILLFALTLLPLCGEFGDSALWAQKRKAREVHLGVLGGAVLSDYGFAPKVSQDKAQGFTFGVAARYVEEEIFGLQAELSLTRRGMKDKYDPELYPNLSWQRNLTYIELPILSHIYFKMGNKNEISVDLGPKFGYYLSDKSSEPLEGEEWETAVSHSFHGYKHHELEVSKRFDYGIQAGIGYEFKFSNTMSLQIQGRYYFGLGNMFPDKKSDEFDNSNNHQIQIVASLWFRQQIAKYMIKKKQKQIKNHGNKRN